MARLVVQLTTLGWFKLAFSTIPSFISPQTFFVSLALHTAVNQTKCFSSRWGAAVPAAHAGSVYRSFHCQLGGPHPAAGRAVRFASAQTQVLPPQPVRPCLIFTEHLKEQQQKGLFNSKNKWEDGNGDENLTYFDVIRRLQEKINVYVSFGTNACKSFENINVLY